MDELPRLTATMIRSQLVLEIAAGLVTLPQQPMRQAKVLLRENGSEGWPLALFASSTNSGIDEVVRGDAALGIVNPSSALTLACNGRGAFRTPQPVLPIAVIPSHDQYLFAVSARTGLTRFEEIAERRYPLRIGVRGQTDHYLHVMLEHITAAAGFTLADIESWGGAIVYDESAPPRAGCRRLKAVANGELDAIFDEGVSGWIDAAFDAGMSILTIAEATVRHVEALGYRRAIVEKRLYPKLPRDILTVDFSGWPIFVHAQLPDALVAQICRALDMRKALIPWEGDGPLPIERMCRNESDTPLDVPLHPGALQFWKSCGYLS
jgi:hypothetical protein